MRFTSRAHFTSAKTGKMQLPYRSVWGQWPHSCQPRRDVVQLQLSYPCAADLTEKTLWTLIFPPKTQLLLDVRVPTIAAAFEISVTCGRQLPGLHQISQHTSACQQVQGVSTQWGNTEKPTFSCRMKGLLWISSLPLYLLSPILCVFIGSFSFFH